MAGAGSLVRNERRVALAWLLLAALVVAFLAVWGVALGGAERVSLAISGRLEQRLARGEQLFDAGRFEEAALELELLDRDHPAVFSKHALDRQRERVLELLARSYAALDRKARAHAA